MAIYVVIPKSQAECNQLISVLHSKGFVCDNGWSWNASVIKTGVSVKLWTISKDWTSGLYEHLGERHHPLVTPNQLSELI